MSVHQLKSGGLEAWKTEIKWEKERLDNFNVLTPVEQSEVLKGSKIMTTAWVIRKKASGKLRERLNARGYEQIDGMHYVAESIAAPVMNPTSVGMFLTHIAMNSDWVVNVIDVEGSFLQGKFVDGDELYI